MPAFLTRTVAPAFQSATEASAEFLLTPLGLKLRESAIGNVSGPQSEVFPDIYESLMGNASGFNEAPRSALGLVDIPLHDTEWPNADSVCSPKSNPPDKSGRGERFAVPDVASGGVRVLLSEPIDKISETLLRDDPCPEMLLP